MNITHIYSMRLIPLLLAGALPLAAHAALSSTVGHKLDKRLAVIATAAQENRTEPLMAAALTREIFQQNSPLEARWNAAGQVQVYLHYDRNGNPPDSAELAALGATGIVNSPALGVVQAWIPADKLENAAALASVTRVSVPSYALVRRSPPIIALPRTGSVDTQGDQILGASQFRASTNYTGQGMVVGVMSGGDDSISQSQSTGDLPTNIWNDPNNSSWGSSGDEGTAMMEIVYDLAPGVKQLGFAGPGTTAEFLTALNDFAGGTSTPTINANVIVDDLGFPGEAMFTNGDFANGVQQFATNHPNIYLVSAAGNDGTAFWAGSWSSTPVNVTINGVTYTQALNFGTPTNPITQLKITDAQSGDSIAYLVEWDDPWVDTSTTNDPNDYDVVMYNSTTPSDATAIACNQGINIGPAGSSASGCNQMNTQAIDTPGPLPVQGSGATLASNETTAYLSVYFGTGNPSNNPGQNLKILALSMNSNQMAVTPPYPNAPIPGSIYGQSAVGIPVGSALTPGEITVGAVCVDPSQDDCAGADLIEAYSSLGPVQFGIPGTGTGTQVQESIQEPSFVAPDCVTTTGAGGFPEPFCGTSAAAPHIAGLLALLLSAYPSSVDPYSLLQDSASQPDGGANPNGVYGFGLPNIDTLLTSATPHYPATGAVITSPASGASIPAGQSSTFESECLGYDGTGAFTYNWNFGTTAIADSTSKNPDVTYNTAGAYTVTLTCTNTVGSGSTTSTVTVTGPRFGAAGGIGLLTLVLLAFVQFVSVRRHL
ncbi:MAG: PKD domain-containing protein [Gammaproteobacteria bacterium]